MFSVRNAMKSRGVPKLIAGLEGGMIANEMDKDSNETAHLRRRGVSCFPNRQTPMRKIRQHPLANEPHPALVENASSILSCTVCRLLLACYPWGFVSSSHC